MNVHTLLATMVFTVAIPILAYAENGNACTGLEASLANPKGDLPKSVVERIRAMARRMEMLSLPTGVGCSDLRKILRRLAHGGTRGGKRLEDDKPLDVAAAQTELQQALQQNPELKAQLDELPSAVADDRERMLCEAALLQSNNLYGPRDLLLHQFIEQAKRD